MDNPIILSICIPTLNRPEFLLESLKSIEILIEKSARIEICVFNNGSNRDYTRVENFIDRLTKRYVNVNYLVNNVTIAIDDSMMQVMKMAKGDYLFLLGDDDILESEGQNLILNILNKMEFDLGILNGVIFNKKNNTRTKIFNHSSDAIISFREAFLKYKNYCSYGNIIVKRNCILEGDQIYLKGTSHAYGCFWLDFFRKHEKDQHPVILIFDIEAVCLRAVEKTYNILQVTFEHTMLELNLYKALIGDKCKIILNEYELLFWYEQSKYTTLLKYGMAGNELFKIKDYNESFYYNYRFRIYIMSFLVIILKPIKPIIRYIILKLRKNV